MNPQDPLAALHPLREPPPVGWWPPAPGWWLLGALALVLLLVLARLLWRRYRANAYRRRALAELERLHRQQQSQPDPRYPAQLNALLKSVALVAYPQREVAAASGPEWLAFLNQSLGNDQQFPPDYDTAAYRAAPSAVDSQQLHKAARAWIMQHRGRS